MTLSNLPNDIVNSISQFCDDKDNSNFVCCYKIATNIIKMYPRQAEFNISKSNMLYKNYRNIHFELNKNATISEIRKLFKKFNSIDMKCVTKLKLNYNKNMDSWMSADWAYIPLEMDINSEAYEVMLLLERMPDFVHVLDLDVLYFGAFRSFHKFPNITKLAMEFEKDYEYPDLPNLKCLVTSQNPFHGNNCLPKNWTNIEQLDSSFTVPDTYINLTYLSTSDDIDIPDNIAKQIKYMELVTLKMGISKYEDFCSNATKIDLNLQRFTDLQKVIIVDAIPENDNEIRKIRVYNCPNVEFILYGLEFESQ